MEEDKRCDFRFQPSAKSDRSALDHTAVRVIILVAVQVCRIQKIEPVSYTHLYPWQSNIAVTASNRFACVVAQSSLTASRVSTSRSPEGSSDRSVRSISTVGMMAWWSVTLLSSVTRSMSGSPAQPFPKGILSRSHRTVSYTHLDVYKRQPLSVSHRV